MVIFGSLEESGQFTCFCADRAFEREFGYPVKTGSREIRDNQRSLLERQASEDYENIHKARIDIIFSRSYSGTQ